MYAIEVTTTFTATHQLRLPDGSLEPLHSHDWRVTARITACELDALETVVDFHQLEMALQSICGPLQNQHLNTIAPFISEWNPSAERVAESIGRQLAPMLNDLPDAYTRKVHLVELRVTEADNCLAIWLSH